MKLVVLAFALALAPALAPAGAAHITDFSQAKAMNLGPYSVIMTPKPPGPMFANTALTMTAVFANTTDGTYVTSGISPSLVLIGGAHNETTPMQPDGSGYYAASVVVAEPGNYTARLVVDTTEGTFSNETNLSVYPEIGIRFRTADPAQPDPFVGEDYTIVIQTYDPDTRDLKDNGTDLEVTLERWSDDHTVMYGAQDLNMTHVATGQWKLQHTFDVKGMYHLRFSSQSGGFKPADVPILHTYANEPTDGSDPGGGGGATRIPSAGLALGIAGVAVVAWAMRRR